MRTLSAAMQTHIAGETTTLAMCWKVTTAASPAVVTGFTNHDKDLVVDSVTYAAATGYTSSNVKLDAILSVDNMELAGILESSGITAADIQAGTYDGAIVEIFLVDWSNPDISNIVQLMEGTVGNITRHDTLFVGELRSITQHLQQGIIEVTSPTCRADLGDARCGVNLVPLTVSGTVTGVTDRSIFTDSSLVEAADYWNLGTVTWTGGDNDGRIMEVKDFASGQVTLYLPMPDDIQVGDTFDIKPGCGKTPITDCKTRYSNLANFRGEPFIPGRD